MPDPTSQQLLPPFVGGGHACWQSLSLLQDPQVAPPESISPPELLLELCPPLELPLEPPTRLPPLLLLEAAASSPPPTDSLLEPPDPPHAITKPHARVAARSLPIIVLHMALGCATDVPRGAHVFDGT